MAGQFGVPRVGGRRLVGCWTGTSPRKQSSYSECAAIGNLTAPPSAKIIDADGGLLTPAFVEPHFHIDKALTHPHLPPTDHERPLDAVLEHTRHIKGRYTPDGLRERAATAIRLAVGHGVGTLRAHVDVDPVGGLSALGVLADLRDRRREMIDIQLVAFPQESIVRDPGALRLLREALTSGADVLGGAPRRGGAARQAPAHRPACRTGH